MKGLVLAAALALAALRAAHAAESALPPAAAQPGAPNILIVWIDDAGAGLPDTLGGEVHTPTLSRLAASSLAYLSLPSAKSESEIRGALLMADALKQRGYDTAYFGKWPHTPAAETGAKGPFERWPAGHGFESFYGFLGEQTSQYQPGLARNTSLVTPPSTPAQGYHLSRDLADDAIAWLRRHRLVAPARPFLVYWAPGSGHGPHQVPRPWADAYRGRFDDGWDAYRKRISERAKQGGWIPAGATLAPRPGGVPAWDAVPEKDRPFQRRLMEAYAGFLEHADANAGRVLDEIERLGYADDTLVLYLWGDGGLPEGGQGVLSAMLARNGIASRPVHHIGALERMGGLPVLGGPKVENVVHEGWAWAAAAPYLPVAISWPARLRAGAEPGARLRAVGDIAPMLYQRLGISPPAASDPSPPPAPPAVSEWSFAQGDTRIPEAIAPRVGSLANTVVIHAELPADASGVLYAVGGIGGGVACYLDAGVLRYEYNIFEIQRVKIQAKEKLAAGQHVIEVATVFGSSQPRAAARVTLSVDGRQLASGAVALTAPVGFAVHEGFDVGADLGSPVALDYFDRAPFAFQGSIERLEVRYPPRSP